MKMKKLLSIALSGVLTLSCLIGTGVNVKAQNPTKVKFAVQQDGKEGEKVTGQITIDLYKQDLSDNLAVPGLVKKTNSVKGISIKDQDGDNATGLIKQINPSNGNKTYELILDSDKILKSMEITVEIEKDGYEFSANNNENKVKIFAKPLKIVKVETDGNENKTSTSLTMTLDAALPANTVIDNNSIILEKASGAVEARVRDAKVDEHDRTKVVITLENVVKTEEGVLASLDPYQVEIDGYDSVKNTDKKVTIFKEGSAPYPNGNNSGNSQGNHTGIIPPIVGENNTGVSKNNDAQTSSDKTDKKADNKADNKTDNKKDNDTVLSSKDVNTTVKVSGKDNLTAKVSTAKIEKALANEQSLVVKNVNQKIVIGTKALNEITKDNKAFKIEVKATSDNAVALRQKTAFNFTINGKQTMLKNSVQLTLPYTAGKAKVYVVGADGKAMQIKNVKYDRKNMTVTFKTKMAGKIVIGK